MADDKPAKKPATPANPDKELEDLQSKGLGGAGAMGLSAGMPDAGMPPPPPPGLNNMEAIINMMMPAAQRLNPQDAMPKFPSLQPWHFQQGPQQPLPPQAGMPLPQ